jgi:hypothetical protein
MIYVVLFVLIVSAIIFFYKPFTFDIVVARYKEDISWVYDAPFNKCNPVIYNKGPADLNIKYITLPNVGKCEHTCIYHIVNNYDKLADVTLFTTGSSFRDNIECSYMKEIIQKVLESKNTCMAKCGIDMIEYASEFTMDHYQSEDLQNRDGNDNVPTLPADTRPFKNWFIKYIGEDRKEFKACGVKGIFAVSKKHIRNFPRDSYIRILEQLETHISPEAGHYVERSWGAFFHPIEDHLLVDAKRIY